MTKHRSHSVDFKRQVAQEFLAGETLHGLAKRHDCSCQPKKSQKCQLKMSHFGGDGAQLAR
jgi:transposase-like protein